jgi:predicted small lipoprotein YifL
MENPTFSLGPQISVPILLKEFKMKRMTSLTLILLCALAVSACGLQGQLQRPDPLWGEPPEAAEEENQDDTNDD